MMEGRSHSQRFAPSEASECPSLGDTSTLHRQSLKISRHSHDYSHRHSGHVADRPLIHRNHDRDLDSDRKRQEMQSNRASEPVTKAPMTIQSARSGRSLDCGVPVTRYSIGTTAVSSPPSPSRSPAYSATATAFRGHRSPQLQQSQERFTPYSTSGIASPRFLPHSPNSPCLPPLRRYSSASTLPLSLSGQDKEYSHGSGQTLSQVAGQRQVQVWDQGKEPGEGTGLGQGHLVQSPPQSPNPKRQFLSASGTVSHSGFTTTTSIHSSPFVSAPLLAETEGPIPASSLASSSTYPHHQPHGLSLESGVTASSAVPAIMTSGFRHSQQYIDSHGSIRDSNIGGSRGSISAGPRRDSNCSDRPYAGPPTTPATLTGHASMSSSTLASGPSLPYYQPYHASEHHHSGHHTHTHPPAPASALRYSSHRDPPYGVNSGRSISPPMQPSSISRPSQHREHIKTSQSEDAFYSGYDSQSASSQHPHSHHPHYSHHPPLQSFGHHRVQERSYTQPPHHQHHPVQRHYYEPLPPPPSTAGASAHYGVTAPLTSTHMEMSFAERGHTPMATTIAAPHLGPPSLALPVSSRAGGTFTGPEVRLTSGVGAGNSTGLGVSTSTSSSSNASEVKSPRRRRRPTESYSNIIVAAIRSSPHQRLKLQEIYDYVHREIPHMNGDDKGWQNTVRHNLSHNKCFKRVAADDSPPVCSPTEEEEDPSSSGTTTGTNPRTMGRTKKSKGGYWVLVPEELGELTAKSRRNQGNTKNQQQQKQQQQQQQQGSSGETTTLSTQGPSVRDGSRPSLQQRFGSQSLMGVIDTATTPLTTYSAVNKSSMATLTASSSVIRAANKPRPSLGREPQSPYSSQGLRRESTGSRDMDIERDVEMTAITEDEDHEGGRRGSMHSESLDESDEWVEPEQGLSDRSSDGSDAEAEVYDEDMEDELIEMVGEDKVQAEARPTLRTRSSWSLQETSDRPPSSSSDPRMSIQTMLNHD